MKMTTVETAGHDTTGHDNTGHDATGFSASGPARDAVVLELKNISLRVRDGDSERTIVDDVSLSIRSGEAVGLVGPSGSGKSTLLTIAGCLRSPDFGSATLYTGKERKPIDLGVRGAAAAAVRRDHIGVVFQQPNLLPALTVRQQLLAMRRLGRVFGWPAGGRKEAQRRAETLLEAVGLGGFGDRRANTLSGGQQARVNLARALMNNPEVLLVDEPTAALDQKSAAAVTRLIMQVTRQLGVATLYVTHDLSQLRGADRIVEMVDGRLRRTAPAQAER